MKGSRRFLSDTHVSAAFLVVSIVIATTQLSAQTITRAPWYESHVDSNSITFSFQTASTVPALIWLGPLTGYDRKSESVASTAHVITFDNLAPATQYLAEIIAANDTVRLVTSTSSDYRSTGSIEVYFNRGVDSTQAITPKAAGNVRYGDILRDKLANAKHSVDLAVYSFGGTIADSVVAWLILARSRRVAIRLIADSASVHDSKQFLSLAGYGIPAIMNSYGANAKTAGNIHHNKFIVIDGRGNDGEAAWVLSGSWNLTEQQTTTDYQNVIHFQDLALARGFEAEFDQEWGSSADLPDARYAKFSTSKSDVTPRTFFVAGTTVHLFFSPNRGAFSGINAELLAAKRQILFALFVFTRSDLALTLVAEHQQGLDIHGVVNSNDKYEQTPSLRAAGIDAIHYTGPSYILLHDKYAIIDAGISSAAVVTGSYNWSLSAEQVNNENVMIVQSNDIAKIYYQDWLARYHENGGSQSVVIARSNVGRLIPFERSKPAYPNPSKRLVHCEWDQLHSEMDHVIIYSTTGMVVYDREMYRLAGNASLSTSLVASAGVYTIVIEHDGLHDVRKIVLTN